MWGQRQPPFWADPLQKLSGSRLERAGCGVTILGYISLRVWGELLPAGRQFL